MARPLLDARSTWSPVADALAARLGEPPGPSLLAPRAFEAWEGGAAVGAVDGGSAVVLEGSGLAVGAVRSAGLVWRAHAPVREAAGPLELALLDDALAERLDARLPGLPPPRGPAGLLERLRALREWERALEVAHLLGEGDVLALDGSLHPPEWPAAFLQGLAAACARRGVHLVGVCKSASNASKGAPLLLAAARAARGLREPWAAPLPPRGPTRAHAVRFTKGARVFKLEFPEGAEAGEALGKLAPWTRDAAYPGYPYPLALAHNACALDEALAEDLAHQLRALAADRGVDAATWEEVFGDFHDVLDRGL